MGPVQEKQSYGLALQGRIRDVPPPWRGSFAAKTNKALVEWMQACGMSNEFLDNFDFDNLDMDTADQSIYDAFEEPVGEFFKTKTKEELHKGCFERNIMLLPVADIDEVAKNPQLASRNYFVDVEVPQWGKTVKFPGSFTKNTETDLVPVEAWHNSWRLQRGSLCQSSRHERGRPECVGWRQGYLKEGGCHHGKSS